MKCFAVLPFGFLPEATNSHAEILCVFQGAIGQLQGKRLRQNRIMSYDAPPNLRLFILQYIFPSMRQTKTNKFQFNALSCELRIKNYELRIVVFPFGND